MDIRKFRITSSNIPKMKDNNIKKVLDALDTMGYFEFDYHLEDTVEGIQRYLAKQKEHFETGDHITITKGIFKGKEAIVQKMLKKMIHVQIIGSEIEVYLLNNRIKKIEQIEEPKETFKIGDIVYVLHLEKKGEIKEYNKKDNSFYIKLDWSEYIWQPCQNLKHVQND